ARAARLGRHVAHRRHGRALASPAVAAARAADPVRQAHALGRAAPGPAARAVRGLWLARRGAAGHTPARRAGPDRRSRLQRPRRRRLRACAGLAVGAGRSVAETGGMNPAGGANDVIDYLDALLDDSQPVAADAAVMATMQAAPAPD